MRIKFLLVGAALAAMLPTTSWAGQERVEFPTNYRDAYVEYFRVDRPGRKGTRYFYVNPEALTAAEPGQELPDGTVLIMEDHTVLLDSNEDPIADSDGRLQPTDEVTNVIVIEKQPGWGSEYPLETRHCDWDYAWFAADGSRKQTDPARFTDCFSCHMNRANRDFTFTFFKYLLDTRS